MSTRIQSERSIYFVLMHLGIVVDHPKRDLAGATMLAYAAARRGIRTSLVPLYEQGVDVPLLGLDAVIVNYARPTNRDLVEGYADAGLPVFVLDTEGGVLAEEGANAPATLAAYVRESGLADLLAGYFFWGPRLRDAFAEHSGMPAARLHVTGCPRFDFAAPRWRELLHYPERGFILVNANFPLVNPRFSQSPEQEAITLLSTGWERDYVDRLLSDLRQIFRGFLAAIRDLAAATPGRRFVVRPHPFEDPQPYDRAFAGVENVKVDAQGSVLNVLHNCACLVHVNCGTSVEAIMLDRVPLSLDFLITDHLRRNSGLSSSISYQAASTAAAAEALANIDALARNFDFRGNYRRYIYPWFSENDGAAAERVVAAVSDFVAAGNAARPSLRRSLKSSRLRSRWGQRLQAAASTVLGSNAAGALRALGAPSRWEKRISTDTVRHLVAGLCRHTKMPVPHVQRAMHPYTRTPLASIQVWP